MTDADKVMHPQHFRTDLTDIRIRINPEIRIRILDDFWLKFWRCVGEGLRSLNALVVVVAGKPSHCTVK